MRSAEKLKYLAGSETGAGMFINDSLPESKAGELRAQVRPVVWPSVWEN
jgi:UDPglucose--hexose-1-phosphate uridylyltransferase